MKTELKIPGSKPELKFPLLAQSKNNGVIVLFSEEQGGTVVHRGTSGHTVGYSARGWVSVYNEEVWTILPPGTQLILTVE